MLFVLSRGRANGLTQFSNFNAIRDSRSNCFASERASFAFLSFSSCRPASPAVPAVNVMWHFDKMILNVDLETWDMKRGAEMRALFAREFPNGAISLDPSLRDLDPGSRSLKDECLPVYRNGHEIEYGAGAAGHVHRDIKVTDKSGQAPGSVHLQKVKRNGLIPEWRWNIMHSDNYPIDFAESSDRILHWNAVAHCSK